MSFIPFGTFDDDGGSILIRETLGNSITTVVGGACSASSGTLILATNATVILGNIISHVDALGLPLLTSGVAGAGFTSYAGSFLSASDNLTVAKVKAVLDISKKTKWQADSGAAVANTLKYTKFALTDAVTIDAATTGTTGQYVFVTSGPTTSKQVYSIFTSAIFA